MDMDIKNNHENTSYMRAKKRVEAIKGLYTHALIIFLIIPLLIFINYRTYWEYQWFWFPIAAGILSVLIHGLVVLLGNNGWEERKIKEFMEKDNFIDNN